MSVQCEFSTIFLNLRMFGLVTENKYLYFVGGLGALITYPLTRIVFYIYVIHKTYSLMDVFVRHLGVNAFRLTLCGQMFILFMSCAYTFVLFKSPRKMMVLETKNKKIMLKWFVCILVYSPTAKCNGGGMDI